MAPPARQTVSPTAQQAPAAARPSLRDPLVALDALAAIAASPDHDAPGAEGYGRGARVALGALAWEPRLAGRRSTVDGGRTRPAIERDSGPYG
jgi:hypothetical protein